MQSLVSFVCVFLLFKMYPLKAAMMLPCLLPGGGRSVGFGPLGMGVASGALMDNLAKDKVAEHKRVKEG